jgi:hypothetical protein
MSVRLPAKVLTLAISCEWLVIGLTYFTRVFLVSIHSYWDLNLINAPVQGKFQRCSSSSKPMVKVMRSTLKDLIERPFHKENTCEI